MTLNEYGEPETYAVRWAQRFVMRYGEVQWTKWHWTGDGMFTACGRPIVIGAADNCPMFPETDERAERVTCQRCKTRAQQVEVTQ